LVYDFFDTVKNFDLKFSRWFDLRLTLSNLSLELTCVLQLLLLNQSALSSEIFEFFGVEAEVSDAIFAGDQGEDSARVVESVLGEQEFGALGHGPDQEVLRVH